MKEKERTNEPAGLHAIVSGRVQGVYFRASTQTEAQRLGLTGWVRNLADGQVEVAAQGERAALKQLLLWLNEGPRLARVDGIESQWTATNDGLESFEIR